jgi:hypothetical protein
LKDFTDKLDQKVEMIMEGGLTSPRKSFIESDVLTPELLKAIENRLNEFGSKSQGGPDDALAKVDNKELEIKLSGSLSSAAQKLQSEHDTLSKNLEARVSFLFFSSKSTILGFGRFGPMQNRYLYGKAAGPPIGWAK